MIKREDKTVHYRGIVKVLQMGQDLRKRILTLDPQEGRTIRTPPLTEEGSWVGAPSILYDEEPGKYLLSYRLRNPRTEPFRKINYHRGYEARIAESTDGRTFTDIWAVSKQEYGARSFERACLRKVGGTYRLYLSYDDPKAKQWRIDLLESEDPSEFNTQERKTILTPRNKGPAVGHVKDPYLIQHDGMWLMFVNYHDEDISHVSETGVAVSEDGVTFEWKGDLFPNDREGWDKGIARLTTLLRVTTETALMLYDCGTSMKEMVCEEKTGVGMLNLSNLTVTRIEDVSLPLTSPYSSGSLRYFDALRRGREITLFFEFATKFKTHELRVQEVRV
ncbi:MAG: hypothetical protein GWO20_20090 [Candidatus Korarchaeota archaeon]|nr:hypothetical protein [Candidatus Korarchaeota archaeon]NIU85536.1 hypothetical protein [Candidatus Thorarchaeota archaeon]NIW15647.1 hypothetical protein [Candidatus Thorarchaeota archaeon]NIW53577.1 hypothetical protein [Candidatus Korarchaeota archaeon]